MEPRSGPTGRETSDAGALGPSAPKALVEAPRQRWRLVLARASDAPRIAGRDLADVWETALEDSGLPIHRPSGRSRGRVAFAAPLPLGVAAEQELAEVFLSERVPVWRLRADLSEHLPAGWRLVDLFDVWVGGPPLAGRVVAADYRIEIAKSGDPGKIDAAARYLLEASALPRERQKGQSTVAYDLRRLLIDVRHDPDASSVRVRTRIDPALGTGRPEEVIAALGERLGAPLDVRGMVRERLVLVDDSD